jgi:hypothetical protein
MRAIYQEQAKPQPGLKQEKGHVSGTRPISLREDLAFAASREEFVECDCAHCDCLMRVF